MDYYIAGVDPGSTIGFVLLDLNGNLVVAESFKGDLNYTLSKAVKYGKIIIVGTDVCKIPKFVEKFASKLLADIVFPDHDLFYYEKRKRTKEYLKINHIKLEDKHQLDALAAALFAYNSHKALFNKIDNEFDKESSYEIKKQVLINKIPIKHAIRNLYF